MGFKTIKLPDLGEGVTEGEIVKIKVSEGESISMDQILLEVMTDKASMEVPSSIEGAIQTISIKEGDIVSVGAELLTVKTKESDREKTKEPKAEKLTKQKAVQNSETATEKSNFAHNKDDSEKHSPPASSSLAIPATRQLAKELDLSLENIKGSGPKGEIKREDLIERIKSIMKSPKSSAVNPPPLPKNIERETEKREPLRGIKRLMFDSMTLSKATIPHFTIGEQVKVEHLMNVREEMKVRLEKQGLKTGWLTFFIKALIPSIKEFPVFNSVYDPQTKEIVFRKDLNIGFAVDSPNGLLVPVLKQAQNKSLLDIIKETQQLAEKARQGSLQREQLTGASITLSNLGSLGGLYGTPIINPPEMAIIGIYSLFWQAVRNSSTGEFEEKPFMNFSITCDHRFIDGATAVRFLKSFTNKIEEPSLLLLD